MPDPRSLVSRPSADEVAAAREAGACWKELEARYGRCRMTLWRILTGARQVSVRVAPAGETPEKDKEPPPEDVTVTS